MTAVDRGHAADPLGLGVRWRDLVAAQPGVRARDAAAELGVSEAELVATRVGRTAVQLDDDAGALLHALPSVGRCMALTRNEHAVSEVRGRYGGIELSPHAGQVVGEAIDLRVFLHQWRTVFALREPHPQDAGRVRRSLQIFDGSGTAVHKVYLEPDGDAESWDALVAARSATPPPRLLVTRAQRLATERLDEVVDRAALVGDWDAMVDTHEFFHLLRKHEVTRVQALRLAGPERALQVPTTVLGRVLDAAAACRLPIMIFVGNRGCLQIFSGSVARIVRGGPWLNVLDPEFNLHVRQDRIAAVWIVRKPTRSGVVTSLEVFDEAGETIALLFRLRDDRDVAEGPAWAELLIRASEGA